MIMMLKGVVVIIVAVVVAAAVVVIVVAVVIIVVVVVVVVTRNKEEIKYLKYIKLYFQLTWTTGVFTIHILRGRVSFTICKYDTNIICNAHTGRVKNAHYHIEGLE